MSTSTVSVAGPTGIYPSGTPTPLLVFNTGTVNVYLGSVSGLIAGANTTVVAPGSSVQWNANTPLYATTAQGTVGTLGISTEVTNVFDAHAIANAIAASGYQFLTYSTPAAAGGVCSVSSAVVPQGYLWLIGRMVVSCNSSTSTTATVYLDSVDPKHILDSTATGNSDIADENTPIVVDSGHTVVCQWNNAANGAVGTINLQVQQIQKVS